MKRQITFKVRTGLVSLLCGLFLISCQSSEYADEYGYDIQPELKPSDEPPSRYGNKESYVVAGKTYFVKPTTEGYSQIGTASWYGKKFHGRPTSTMEPFDMFSISAAHPSLPIPTYVRVTNLENNASMIVRVNDRGPFHDNRIIDLSYGAAVRLGFAKQGTAQVKVEALAPYQVRWNSTDQQPIANQSYSNQPYNSQPYDQQVYDNQPNGYQPSDDLLYGNQQYNPQANSANLSEFGSTYSAAYSSDSTNQRFVYLQAGAYLDSMSAQKAKSRLEFWLNSRNIQEQVHLVFSDGYQKLHLGPLGNFNAADNIRQQLSNSPWGKPIWIEVNPNR